MDQHKQVMAARLFRSGDLETAALIFETELEQGQSSDPAVLHALGMIYNLQGRYEQSYALLRNLVSLTPNDHIAQINLAECLRNLGHLQRARSCCGTALKLHPDFPDGILTLGLVLQDLSQFAEAADQFKRVLELCPDNATAHNNLGIALQELNEIDEAVKCFNNAIEMSPENEKIYINLGTLLLKTGRLKEAEICFRESVRLCPDKAIFHHNLGNVLRGLGKHTKARSAYLEALRIEPQMVIAHLHTGVTLRKEGRIEDALFWYKEAVTLDPDNYLLWEQLADLHGERDETREAIDCWRRSIELSKQERAIAHLGLGGALQDEGQLSEAMEQFRVASSIDPYSALPLVNIGNINQELGNLAEAEVSYRSARRLQPDCVLSYARLATLLRDKLPDEDLVELEIRLSDPKLTSQFRARLLFALAHVLDAREDYSRASELLREANALTLENAIGYRSYEVERYSVFVDKLIYAFTDHKFINLKGTKETGSPIFVFGMPRSGTTLIEQILSSHKDVFGAGELRLVKRTFEAIPEMLGLASPSIDCVPCLTDRVIDSLASRHLDNLHSLCQTEKHL